MINTQTKRQPAGVPTGGQFAVSTRGRTAVRLNEQPGNGDRRPYTELNFLVTGMGMVAEHPVHGEVGAVEFTRRGDNLSIDEVTVSESHRGRHVATAMMREIERRHPDAIIDHAYRTEEGRAWADKYYGPHATARTPNRVFGNVYESLPTRGGAVVEGAVFLD